MANTHTELVDGIDENEGVIENLYKTAFKDWAHECCSGHVKIYADLRLSPLTEEEVEQGKCIQLSFYLTHESGDANPHWVFAVENETGIMFELGDREYVASVYGFINDIPRIAECAAKYEHLTFDELYSFRQATCLG